jgi:hypothetical protein
LCVTVQPEFDSDPTGEAHERELEVSSRGTAAEGGVCLRGGGRR